MLSLILHEDPFQVAVSSMQVRCDPLSLFVRALEVCVEGSDGSEVWAFVLQSPDMCTLEIEAAPPPRHVEPAYYDTSSKVVASGFSWILKAVLLCHSRV